MRERERDREGSRRKKASMGDCPSERQEGVRMEKGYGGALQKILSIWLLNMECNNRMFVKGNDGKT